MIEKKNASTIVKITGTFPEKKIEDHCVVTVLI